MDRPYSTRMNTRRTLRRQRGVVMIMATIAMVAIVAMAGLALDSGNLYLAKTRLQNAVDAAALSAAKELKSSTSMAAATAAANATFGENLDAPGSETLATAWADGNGDITLTVEYSPTLNPFVSSGTPPYVRVIATGVTLETWLLGVVGVDQTNTTASAVSGPVPVTGICDLVPMLACGCDPSDSSCCDGLSDPSCGSSQYYGYDVPDSSTELALEDITSVKISSGNDQDIGPGNFHLLRLGDNQGGNYIRDALAGAKTGLCADYDPTTGEETVDSEPGNKVGPAITGLNARFDGGTFGTGQNQEYVYPDYVTQEALEDTGDQLVADENNNAQAESGEANPDLFDYNDYLGAVDTNCAGGETCNFAGTPYRRMMVLPIGHCSGLTNGTSTPIDVQGYGCFMLLQRGGQGNSGAHFFGQFVGAADARGCDSAGGIDPNASNSLPTQIVLFRDPDSGDS